jgi:thiol-disulfide isomerase/thioredoxin
MANIVDILYENYLRPYQRQLLIFMIFIIFAVAAYYCYSWYAKPVIENQSTQDMANFNDRVSEAKVMVFTADWCPHCKRAKPEWEKFVETNNGKIIGNYQIVTETVDCSDGENPKIQQYSIDGYPTLFLLKDENQRISFDAKITEENLNGFINSVLQ